jgi:hypothetical protein
MTKPVTAVIVHWGDAEETIGCAQSVVAEPDVEVIVVDNGSHEPVGDRLAAAVPGVVCVRSEKNRGYTGGANLGIEAALERGAPVILLLNNDARVRPGAVDAARRVLDRDGRIGVVGARVVTREDPRRLWLAWGTVTWRQSLVGLVGADVPDGLEFAHERDVAWVSGCAMWLRAEALAAVGLFDETFFAYHEEVDWCARATEAGWRVVYVPDVVVSHTGRGSHGDAASIRRRKYFAARNTILYARKHGSRAQHWKLAALLALSLPLELIAHLPRGDVGQSFMKVRGVFDALLGRNPPLWELGLT